MKGNRRSEAHPRRSGVRVAFVFTALFAVFLQTFAIQTHVHAFFAPATTASVESSVEADLTHHGAQATASDHQTICVICQSLAAGGSVTLTNAAQVAEHATLSSETAARDIRLAPRARAHSWHSRAPPITA